MQKRVNLVDLVKSFQTSTSIYNLLAKFRFDTAENESLIVCQKLAKSWNKIQKNIGKPFRNVGKFVNLTYFGLLSKKRHKVQ